MSNRTILASLTRESSVVTEESVYIISAAARLVEMHPQTLRKYERAGFLEPSRSGGNLRRYSTEDIERLLQIKRLVDDRGINLAGVELALQLTRQLRQLEQVLAGTPSGVAAEAERLILAMLEELGIPTQRTDGGTGGKSIRH